MEWHVDGLCRTKLKSISQCLIFIVSWPERAPLTLFFRSSPRTCFASKSKPPGAGIAPRMVPSVRWGFSVFRIGSWAKAGVIMRMRSEPGMASAGSEVTICEENGGRKRGRRDVRQRA